MLLLYYVPDSQRATYLKEISSLARLLQSNGAMRDVSQAGNLNDVRLRLLDIVTAAAGAGQAEARAHMIRLKAPAVAAPEAPPFFDPALVFPAWIIHTPDGRAMVLARDENLVRALESLPDLGARLEKQPFLSVAGHAIHVRQSATFGLGRSMFDCLVVKTAPRGSP